MNSPQPPMEVLNLITRLEGKLKAYLSLSALPPDVDAWQLEVRLFYDGGPAGATSFNLRGYSQEEAEAIAKGFRHNQFMMQEIDQLLWGESD